jgi:hypothetical protein
MVKGKINTLQIEFIQRNSVEKHAYLFVEGTNVHLFYLCENESNNYVSPVALLLPGGYFD